MESPKKVAIASPSIKVTAAVIEINGRILIARRRRGGRYGGKWEFPGGKVEPGESPQSCLKRELAEELGIEAVIGDFLGSFHHKTSRLSIELLVYRASLRSGCLHAREHEEIRWAEKREMDEAGFSGPDKPVVRSLKEDAHPAGEGDPESGEVKSGKYRP